MPPECAKSSAGGTIEWNIALPLPYRATEVLAFHGRDPAAVAESVRGQTLRKAFMYSGAPACLELALGPGSANCRLTLDTDQAVDSHRCQLIAQRLLGLHLDIDRFEALARADPTLAPLARAQAGLRIPLAATPFEALTWAITGQQINLGVALQLRRRLVLLAGRRHSRGLYCYPEPTALAALTAQQLADAKFSRTKTQALLTVSRMVCNGELPLDQWLLPATPVAIVSARLLAIRGIGPWTVSYTLLRGYGWADGSLHGDAALRKALQRLLRQQERVTSVQAEDWLAVYAPWRSLVAAHLWASLSAPA